MADPERDSLQQELEQLKAERYALQHDVQQLQSVNTRLAQDNAHLRRQIDACDQHGEVMVKQRQPPQVANAPQSVRRFPAKNLPSIAPDVSSGSRRSRGHITPLCNRSDNAEAELTDKRDGKMISGNRLNYVLLQVTSLGDRHVSKCRRVEYGKTPIVSVDFEHGYWPRAYATARLVLLASYQSPCVAIPSFLGGEDVNLLAFYPLVTVPFFLGQDISECSMYDCRFSVFRFFHSFSLLFSFYLDLYLYKEEGAS
jgi:hypothetical protein